MDWLPFSPLVTVVAAFMLVWACIEVGSNDAANLVNAVFGSRVLKRRMAVNLAGVFVIIGAAFASPVLDTVRKGIFDFSGMSDEGALAIFIATYLVNTLLLNLFSSFGMPVSSTVILVFSLAGGAIGAGGGVSSVRLEVFQRVVLALLTSILASGSVAFLLQRLFRYFIRKDCSDPERIQKHGPWIAGIIFTSLVCFLGLEALKDTRIIQALRDQYPGPKLWASAILFSWATFSALTYLAIKIGGRAVSNNIFKFTSILGICSLAFSFGQNDLGNCAAPGLAIFLISSHGLTLGSEMQIPVIALIFCGAMIFVGMRTKRAQRVTRAEINTASQQAQIKLYAPQWAQGVARFFLNQAAQIRDSDIAPDAVRNIGGKKLHYDPLRASVILTVNSSVIAFASGFGLPISATYVGFISVLATGWGDRVFTRGQSELKLGRAIFVLCGWLFSAVLSFGSAFILATFVSGFKSAGLILCLIGSRLLQWVIKHTSDKHERLHHKGVF